MNLLAILWIFSCLTLSARASPTNTGNICNRNSDGEKGICLPVNECPEFFKYSKRKNETLCGIDKQIPLVCCVAKPAEARPEDAVALSFAASTKPSKTEESISQRKCQEYSRLEYEDKNTDTCTIKPDGSKIGRAKLGEFPHMASLLFESLKTKQNKSLCGGSLISEKFVLTAAHCISYNLLEDNALRLSWVIVGAVNLSSNATDNRQIIPIAQLILHPDFNNSKPLRALYFDIGLLKLQKAPILGPLVRPACLPLKDESFSSRDLILTGWGKTNTNTESETLNKVVLYEASYAFCQKPYTFLPMGLHNSSMMCAGHPTGRSNSCAGDSGGPLQTISQDVHCMYTIVAVTSFGYRTCGSNVPSVYSRVQYFQRWIENIVWD